MSISAADRAVIERWYGRVDHDDEVHVDGRLQVWGSPHLTALELLMRQRGEMRRSPASSRSDVDASDHSANLDPEVLDKAISDLAHVIRSTTDSLSAEAQELVAEAIGPVSSTSSMISVTADNRRRG